MELDFKTHMEEQRPIVVKALLKTTLPSQKLYRATVIKTCDTRKRINYPVEQNREPRHKNTIYI